MTKSNEKHVQAVIDAVLTVSRETGCAPQDVTIQQVKNHVTNHTVLAAGGLTTVKKAHFPEMGKDLAGMSKNRQVGSYIRTLETKLGNRQSLEEELIEVLKENIKPLPKIKFSKPKQVAKKKIERHLVAMLNDTHIGLIVDAEEIGDKNAFDFKECGRRFALFVKQVSEYKKYARSEVKTLHLILNGDIIAGIIHGLTTRTIHQWVHQMNGATHILSYAIGYLLQEFECIEVHAIAGNHDRATHKEHGQRPVAEVFDSYVNSIYYALSLAFKDNKRVSFNIPKTAYGFIDLPAGRAMYAHGDHIFSRALGNPGKSINVKGIESAIRDFNAGEISQGKAPIKLLLLGHVHVFAHFVTSDGVEVYIAPSLSGLDQFAHSLTINSSLVGQVVFESTKDYILGDSRLIRLDSADKDKSLDAIIPEYKKELKFKKG